MDSAGAIALDTEQSSELFLAIQNLSRQPERAQSVRQTAPYVAARYVWENVLTILFEKIELASTHQNTKPFLLTRLDLEKPVWVDVFQSIFQMTTKPETSVETASHPASRLKSIEVLAS